MLPHPLVAFALTVLLALFVLTAAFGPATVIRVWRYHRARSLLRQRYMPSPGVRLAMAVRMSWLSVGLRDIGLGSVVDALDGVEGSVKTAVLNTPAVEGLEATAVDDVGTAAQKVVVDAIAKAAPGASTLAAEVTTPLLAGLEAYVLHFIQNATATTEATPPPAA